MPALCKDAWLCAPNQTTVKGKVQAVGTLCVCLCIYKRLSSREKKDSISCFSKCPYMKYAYVQCHPANCGGRPENAQMCRTGGKLQTVYFVIKFGGLVTLQAN